MITTSPMAKTVNYGQGATLTCSGSGYPVPTITWTSPTGSSFTAQNPTVASGIATRIIDVTNQKGADGGGTFKCTASNGIGNDASAQAIISGKPVMACCLRCIYLHCFISTSKSHQSSSVNEVCC